MAGYHDIDGAVRKITRAIEEDRHEELTLYDGLAPIYDYLYGDAYDYDLQATYVSKVMPDGAVDVLSAGCGTGHLLARLAENHPAATLHGIDLHEEMVGIARDTLEDIDNVSIDCEDVFEIDATYDVVAAFNLLPHFDDETLSSFFDHIESLLTENGAIVFDYKDPHNDVNGMYSPWETETDEFTIMARFITVYDEGHSYYAASYEFAEKTTEKQYYTSELMEIHFQTPARLQSMLREAGFEDVTIDRGVGDQSGVVTART